MPALTIPPSGLLLEGSKSSSSPEYAGPAMVSLALSDNVIEDMIKCVRSGKELHLSLGSDPKIIYGNKTQHFSSSPDPFTHELYRSAISSNPTPQTPNSTSSVTSSNDNMVREVHIQVRRDPAWFMGVLGIKMKPAAKKAAINSASATGTAATTANGKNNAASVSTSKFPDEALTTLKNSLAIESAKKAQNTTKLVKDSSFLPPAVQQRGSAHSLKASNKNRFLGSNKPSANDTTRSMPASPAMSRNNSPALAPTTVPFSQQQAEKTKAIRSPIIHQLALAPATEARLVKFRSSIGTIQDFKIALEKVADLEKTKWVLKNKSYRELDVWKYNYSSSADRQSAIDNAVRAYDKLRLNRSEPEWDRLLPKEERGTGKCLSKLQAKIAENGPLPAKKKAKINNGEESGRDTGAEDNDNDLFGETKNPVSGLKAEAMTRSYSQPPSSKPKKVSEKEAQARRLLAKPGKTPKAVAPKKVEKKTPEKIPKFKSSEFVGDSDEEDTYLLPAKKASAPAPEHKTEKAQSAVETAAKRPLENADTGNNGQPITKKPKKDEGVSSASSVSSDFSKHRTSDASHTSQLTNTTAMSSTTNSARAKGPNSPQKSSPLASSPPTNASDIDEYQTSSSTSSDSMAQSNSLKRKLESNNHDFSVKRHQKTPSSSSSSSDWNNEVSAEVREKSAKFKVYYRRYAQLHDELTGDASRRAAEMSTLLEMEKRLADMKKDILRGARA